MKGIQKTLVSGSLSQTSDKNNQTTNKKPDIKPDKNFNNQSIHKTNLVQASLQWNESTSSNTNQLQISTYNITSKYDTWGHSLTQKKDTDTRIVLRNISTLPQESKHNKNDIFIHEITQINADVYCATEINLAWQHLTPENKLQERFKGKLEFAKYTSSNNKDKNFKGTFQPGGTLMVSNGSICGRIHESGTEDHILQRWTWQKMRGRNNMNIVIATIYRPVHSLGPLSTYQQHRAVLLDMNIDECPRKNILTNLRIQIQNWQKEGLQVVVAGDFNEDVTSDNLKQFFNDLQMKELITSQHTTTAPGTMIKGSKPIDGIFGSKDMIPIRSGYLGFEWGLATDHRLIWLDIPTSNILGTVAPPLWKPAARRLKCEDPNIVHKFNKIRKDIFEKLQGPQLLRQLKHPELYDTFTQWQKDFDELDNIRVESIRKADNKCRKLKMGNIPWSPTIQICMANISYLQRCRLKYINGYNINSRTIQKSFQKTTFSNPVTDPNQIVELLKQEFKKYNNTKKQADGLRANFLANLAASKAEANNGKQEKIYKQLLLHEAIRSTFRKIKYVTKDSRSGVTIVEAPNENGEWVPITDKTDIEQKCIEENIRRATQASESPTMQRSQRQLLGWKAHSDMATQILQGTIQDLTGINKDLIELIPYMSQPETIQNLDPIRHDITTDEYKWMWKRTREYTSCGISGLHFGHFLASSKDPELCAIDKWFMEISLNSGCSLSRWQRGIDVMIPKKANSYRVDKLRTIVLMEPDFNFINKIIGKRVMMLAEAAESIAPEQFGSRKRKSAIVHAVNKQITTDILRQDKNNFSLMILDAKDCYGRITPMMASFAMKRQGASQPMMDLMFDTIAKMKHYIRTSFGDSDITYQQENKPFHGILQGNGAGPTVWAMISTILLDKLRDKGIGVKIKKLDNTEIIIPAFAFVDDTDLLQELQDENDTTSPQSAVKEWNQGLQTTGGSIVGDKCVFQIVQHKWEKDSWQIEKQTNDKIKIIIPNDDGSNTEIRQSSAFNGEVALGIAFSPTGDMQHEIDYLKSKTSSWATKIQKSQLTHYEAWTALRTTIFKTIEYALPSTTLSKKEIRQVISPAMNSGLSKAGICRKISRTIIFSSVKYQGFGIKDPYVSQGVMKIQLLFNTANVLTLQLINESWQRSTAECGIGPDMFHHSYPIYSPILTKGWITNLWEFIHDSNIELHRAEMPTIFRIRQDSYLVQKVFESGNWSVRQKQDFNYCRLFLKVEILSDIITANGMQVRRHVFNGIEDDTKECFCHIRTKTSKPSKRAWNNWKRMLQHTYNIDETGNIRPAIDPIPINDNWTWYIQPSTDRIFKKTEKDGILYTGNSSGRSRTITYEPRHAIVVPENIIPITVYKYGRGIRIDGIGTARSQPRTRPNTNWCSTIQHSIKGNLETLQEFLKQEQIILLSDATVGDNGGFAAWIITTPNAYGNQCYIQGYGKVFEETTDSHRAECFGILGALNTYKHYSDLWNIKAAIQVVCDNQAAINYACNHSRYRYVTSNMPDYDVLTAIREALIGENHTFQHVKGHQERSQRPWSIYTTLNIAVDQLASVAQEDWEKVARPLNYDYIGNEKWILKIRGQRVHKNIDSSIRDFITEENLPDIWQKYKRIKKEWFYEVDWSSLHKTMQTTTVMQRLWLLKRCARDCGAHAILKRRKEREDDFCPFCSNTETVEHVYTCQHPSVQEVWLRSIKDLEIHLTNIHTDPKIIEQLIDGLHIWRTGAQTASTPMCWDQDNIGWNGILEGTIGKHWSEEQQLYRAENNLAMSGKQWARAVIRKLWLIAWELWTHRNQEAHRNDAQLELQETLKIAQGEIDQGTQGYKDLEHWLKPQEIRKVYQGNLQYVQCWIRLIQAKRARARRKHEESPVYNQMRRTLRQFLQPT